VKRLGSLFHNITVVDRREYPNNGYRAVHVIVNQSGKLVEVQVRTVLQHGWAELSEKASDLIDPEIKYGGGDPDLQGALLKISSLFARQEYGEHEFRDMEERASRLLSIYDVPSQTLEKIQQLKNIMDNWRSELVSMKSEIMTILEEDDE